MALAAGAALAVLLFAAPAPAGPRRVVRVLTWNVGTLDPRALRLPERDLPRVAEVIRAASPDVALLQEVAPGQTARLLARLPGWHGATEVVDPAAPDGLSVVLTRERPRRRPRAALPVGWRAQGAALDGFTAVAVHAPSSGPDDRAAYFDQLLAWTRGLEGPLLVAGDFNLGPRRGAGAAALLPWLRRKDVATWARFAGGFDAATTPVRTTVYLLALDHLLVRGGRVAASRVLPGRRFPQDHDPLLVEVELASSTGARGALERARR